VICRYVDEQPTGMLLVGNALFVAGGRELMTFNVTNPRNATVIMRPTPTYHAHTHTSTNARTESTRALAYGNSPAHSLSLCLHLHLN
jgi:hypothetical protein